MPDTDPQPYIALTLGPEELHRLTLGLVSAEIQPHLTQMLAAIEALRERQRTYAVVIDMLLARVQRLELAQWHDPEVH